MHLQERIEATDRIISEFRDLLGSDVNTLRQESGIHAVNEIKRTLEGLRDQGRVMQIGIIGRVKAGKSSLLNAMFFDGTGVLPHAATPMTAALTTLTYGEQPSMRAEFFCPKDLETFHRLHNDHEQAIKNKETAIADRSRQVSGHRGSSIQQNHGGPSQTEPRHRELAKKEAAKEDPVRAAGWELWKSVQDAGGIEKLPTEEKVVRCTDIDDLRGHLANYVGARGLLTPFTKCLHLELPIERLRDLCVVDTPGLNDPIISREHRTRSMLRDCDAVFIVSPAGQFLSQQDEELMERLSTREGVRAIYVVASQFDTQLFGYEYQEHGGNLDRIIQVQQSSLTRHANNVLGTWTNTLSPHADPAIENEARLRISSSAAHALLQDRLPQEQDETVQFVHTQLLQKYPDYFGNQSARAHWLKVLSGIQQLDNDLSEVRENKQQIFLTRIDAYLKGQEEASRTWLELLLKNAEARQHEFESSDLSATEAKLGRIAEIAGRGTEIASETFADQIDDRRITITSAIQKAVKHAFKEVSSEAEAAQGTTTERREKSGVGAWFARKLWGGGSEDVSVETVNTKKVRDAVNEFRNLLENGLNLLIENHNDANSRNNLARSIFSRLREEIGDEYVNPDDIRRIGKSILLGIQNIPGPRLPELPEELSATGKLTGWQKDEFMAAAEKYLDVLRREGNDFAKVVDHKLKAVRDTPVGSQIFGALYEEAKSLKLQLQNKRLTAERYSRLTGCIQEVLL